MLDTFWSDHFPLKLECDINVIRLKTCAIKLECNGIRWEERNTEDIARYSQLCSNKLKNVEFPEQFERCADKFCNNLQHKSLLNKLYKNIVYMLGDAACNSRTLRGIIGNYKGIKG